MNSKPIEYKPFKSYVINTTYSYTGTLEKSLGGQRWLVKTLPLGTPVEAEANTITQIINDRPDYWCMSCYDTGLIGHYDASTDALTGYDFCTDCKPVVSYLWISYILWYQRTDKFIPDNATPPF